MRLMIIMSSLCAGGAERVSLDLASYLASHEHEVHLMIARRSNRTPGVYSLPNGVICHWAKWGVDNRISRPIVNYVLIKRLLRNIKPDWVISLGAQYKLLSASGAFDACRVLLSERNYPPERYTSREFNSNQKAYNLADRIIFQTGDIANCYPKLPREKVRIIPNAIRFGNTRWKGNDSNKVSFVGRLIEQKNPKMLLKAFALFHVTHPDYSLHVFGDGPLDKELREQAEALQISEFVSFHGQVTGIAEELASSRMYISTSDYEGISNSMLEALAIGVPIISTDCAGGGARLAIDNDVNGLLVPCGDVQALAAAMGSIASDAELANNLSSHAIESSQRFSKDRIYRLWEEALR